MSDEPKPSEGALSAEQAEFIEAEMRRMETDPNVDKHTLRLFMQSPMPCGHSVGELMTCDKPPFGCAVCLALDRLRQRVAERDGEWIGALVKVIQPQFMELAKRPDEDGVSLEEIVRMFVHADRREREMKRQ